MKNLYIIVLNWKHADDTIDCLNSLQSIKLPKDIKATILVIDNNSGKKDLKKLHNYKSKIKLEIVENKENYGFAGGNNVGLKYAMNRMADYMIILNNDTKVDPHFVSELVKCAEADEKIGIVSPKIYFEKGHEFHKEKYEKDELGRVIWAAGGAIDWNNVFGVNRGVDDVDNGQYDRNDNLDFATGACLLVTRKAILKVGFFDERYFLYFEDLDFCKRVLDKDLKIVFYPSAKIWHKVSGSSAIGDDLNDYFITRNRLLFGLKYASLKTKIALIRQNTFFIFVGRKMQKKGIIDYLKRNFGKGSWKN